MTTNVMAGILTAVIITVGTFIVMYIFVSILDAKYDLYPEELVCEEGQRIYTMIKRDEEGNLTERKNECRDVPSGPYRLSP